MKTGGIGASLSATIHESLFNELDHEVRAAPAGPLPCPSPSPGLQLWQQLLMRLATLHPILQLCSTPVPTPHHDPLSTPPHPPPLPAALPGAWRRSSGCPPRTCPPPTPTSWRRPPSCSRSRWGLGAGGWADLWGAAALAWSGMESRRATYVCCNTWQGYYMTHSRLSLGSWAAVTRCTPFPSALQVVAAVKKVVGGKVAA